jgi:hypothetical protein
VSCSRYALDAVNAPTISAINGVANGTAVVSTGFGASLSVTWAPKVAGRSDVKVTSVALVAPSASTHGLNSNQRLVWLPITASTLRADGSGGTLTVTLPTNKNVAPPQMYMLFLNNIKTYSRAWWVHLKDW